MDAFQHILDGNIPTVSNITLSFSKEAHNPEIYTVTVNSQIVLKLEWDTLFT